MRKMGEKELNQRINDLSLQFFQKPFRDQAVFNNRLRTTGGRYIPSRRTIEVNPKYALEFDEDELIGILKHELCHYHLHIEGKGYKHGDKDFKELLKKTGSPRHCRPLPSVEKQRKHWYRCKQCGHVYTRVRRINLKKYRCGKCRGELLHDRTH
ncbi:SprT family protein [Lentibacillus cibarius]|uniref:Protein SprT-like n=1 Tax=Lentibacillus cibarius TaxID=2583219 RepID=A0A549YHP2_9BACI|nr:SprT family protein [Lentibacillus cibarius]TRM11378.1 SprT family protein [Lentibacillus cibarius]